MVTGFSLKGGRPRCFAFYQDFHICYLTSEDPNVQCMPYRDDYFECIHHFKEIRRAKIIADNANKRKADQAEQKTQLEDKGKSAALNAILNRGTTSTDTTSD